MILVTATLTLNIKRTIVFAQSNSTINSTSSSQSDNQTIGVNQTSHSNLPPELEDKLLKERIEMEAEQGAIKAPIATAGDNNAMLFGGSIKQEIMKYCSKHLQTQDKPLVLK
jgi:hypothetical protein